jgi:glycosyltransferase involved in cell wall biosynthesis
VDVLVLISRPIFSRQNGYDLRVANLCAHIPGALHLVVAPLGPPDEGEQTLSVDGLFESVNVLEPIYGSHKRLRRHLRLTNDRVLELSFPRRYAVARDRLRAIVRGLQISRVVVFGSNLAELAATLHHPQVIVDVSDSLALTARRELEFGAGRLSGRRLWKARLELRRWRATEARLPHRFRQVTTISPPDTRELETLAGPGSNVLTVPNGVESAFLDPLPDPSRRRGVVFWGNLAFGPNDEALRFFLNDVYRPLLRPAGVEVCIVGPNAPRWLIDFAATDTGVVLAGYVPDLRASVTRYPVMVNPMLTGSGLKNKVLEAFALGIAVVSTPLGIEALPEVRDGVHVLEAEDATSFGEAVLDLLESEPRRLALRASANSLVGQHYRWDVIGASWRALFEDDRRAFDPDDDGVLNTSSTL